MAVWLPCPEQPHSTSQNSPTKLPSQAQVEPSLVPCSPQLAWQNCPAQLPSQVQESAEQEFASRAASMLPVRLPCAPQSGMGHSVSQKAPMKLPLQAQEPAEQEPAAEEQEPEQES